MPVISVVSLKLDLSSVQEEMNSLKMKRKHIYIYISCKEFMHQKNYVRGMDQLIVKYKITKYTFIRVSIRWRNSHTRKAINSLILSSEKVKNNQSNKSSNLQKEVQENSQCCKRMCKWNLNNWPEIKHHDNNRNIKTISHAKFGMHEHF